MLSLSELQFGLKALTLNTYIQTYISGGKCCNADKTQDGTKTCKRQLFSETGKQKGIYHNILHYFEFDS